MKRKNEKTVRKWFKDHFSERDRIAVEPGMGGDDGLSDQIIKIGWGRVACLELKRTDHKDDLVLRPSQERMARKAISWGVPYLVLCRTHWDSRVEGRADAFSLFQVMTRYGDATELEFILLLFIDEDESFDEVIRVSAKPLL